MLFIFAIWSLKLLGYLAGGPSILSYSKKYHYITQSTAELQALKKAPFIKKQFTKTTVVLEKGGYGSSITDYYSYCYYYQNDIKVLISKLLPVVKSNLLAFTTENIFELYYSKQKEVYLDDIYSSPENELCINPYLFYLFNFKLKFYTETTNHDGTVRIITTTLKFIMTKAASATLPIHIIDLHTDLHSDIPIFFSSSLVSNYSLDYYHSVNIEFKAYSDSKFINYVYKTRFYHANYKRKFSNPFKFIYGKKVLSIFPYIFFPIMANIINAHKYTVDNIPIKLVSVTIKQLVFLSVIASHPVSIIELATLIY
eukprot:Mrub_02264.p2 GENE.Mrub_02264~~Mrub_02264.p2  ORF type:complete len:312 (+),score=-5.19 Mrub_02264:88-1023(+)